MHEQFNSEHVKNSYVFQVYMYIWVSGKITYIKIFPI